MLVTHPPDSFAEILTPSVMVLGCGAFGGRVTGLDEVTGVGPQTGLEFL